MAASRRAAKRIEEGRRKAGCAGPSSGAGGGDRWGGAAARASKSRGTALQDAGGLENDLGLLAVGTSISQGPLSPASSKPAAQKPRRGCLAGGGRRSRAGGARGGAGGRAGGAPAPRGPRAADPALSLSLGGPVSSAR